MKLILVIINLCIASIAEGQYSYESETFSNKRDRNVIRNSYGANSTAYAIQYEHVFAIQKLEFFSLATAVGAGVGAHKQNVGFFTKTKTKRSITIPFHLTGNWGINRSYLEAGFGGAVVLQEVILFAKGGYRFMPLEDNPIGFRVFGCFPLNFHHHGSSGIFDTEYIDLEHTKLLYFFLGASIDVHLYSNN